MGTIGNPSWQAEVVPGGVALITVTYPAPLPPTVGAVQYLSLPIADLADLADVIGGLLAIPAAAE